LGLTAGAALARKTSRQFLMLSALATTVAIGATTVATSAATRPIHTAAVTTTSTNGDWPSYNRDLANDRFSPLANITPSNIARLHQICSVAVPGAGGQGANASDIGFETGPIVVNGVLYATTIHATYAFNASSCAPIWSQLTGDATQGLANRGAVYDSGKIVRGTLGNHVIAYDALSGTKLWDTGAIAAFPAFITASPIVWRGAVFIGLAGADAGSHGAIFALDENTGRTLWSSATVPPDPVSGMVPPGADWAGASHIAGGSTWSSYTLDPYRGLLLVSTGNPAPDFYGAARLGDNASTDSLLVFNAFSGALLKKFAFDPHDVHDWDIAASSAYLPASGTAFVAGKDGLLRRVSLLTGATQWKTAVTTVDAAPALPAPGTSVHFCPGTAGGVEWNGPAFSPLTSTVYVNSVDWCNTLTLPSELNTSDADNSNFALGPVFYIPGAPYVDTLDYSAPPANQLAPFGVSDASKTGHVTAVDAATGRRLWQYNATSPMLAGITPTAGGLVFTADLNGNLFAFDARTGAVLKQIAIGQPVGGGVITYSVAAHQFVAVAAGMQSPQVWSTTGTNKIVVFGL
jgi:alcohol dehydrogenase (cytochrome c)